MGTVAEEQYHLRWNDYHSSLTKCFRDLRDNDEMLDVIIISDGRTFKAHKLGTLRKSRHANICSKISFFVKTLSL